MENRKTQIIDLALKLIQQKGYVAFSYDDISKPLGITKASVHYHFEKKEDLGVAVGEQILQSLQKLSMAAKDPSLTVQDKLMLFINKRTEQFTRTEICPISSLQADFESLPDRVREKVEEISQLEMTIMQTIVAEALNKEQTGGKDDSQSLSVAILASIKGALIYRRVLGDSVLEEVLKDINQRLKTA
ncbi:TetR family transcriptional regulator [Pullulanibacillus camelliae]|uniref:TetR family transcriptional regulator n=1 Tax=Pullulanibacillus camelliae TaxID=1707096 RepID=A0A8J3E0Q5_9BACL|nr:TetR/AcrR family transcriptional regulator [Pullulanibacillus camelliae]GGE55093.1 TetR family transcriptional regulator [Pullulanibacillus camelliae]